MDREALEQAVKAEPLERLFAPLERRSRFAVG
jgi:hypothetical protein